MKVKNVKQLQLNVQFGRKVGTTKIMFIRLSEIQCRYHAVAKAAMPAPESVSLLKLYPN